MTNPDLSGLMKLLPLSYEDGPDYCTVKDAEGDSFALTMYPEIMKEMEAALRRLAASDGVVKGEPVACRFDHADGTHSFHSEKLSPGLMKHCVPLYTAPPADAGMREASERAIDEAAHIASLHTHHALWHGLLPYGWDAATEQFGRNLAGAIAKAIKTELPKRLPALTAPGATTKSDGGESFVTTNPDGSVTLDAYAGKSRDELKARCRELCQHLNEWQFIAMEAATAHGNCLSNVPENARTKIANMIEAYRDDDEPGPSDPSSTRSEVTVAHLRAFIYVRQPIQSGYLAIELLDQFEIRRK